MIEQVGMNLRYIKSNLRNLFSESTQALIEVFILQIFLRLQEFQIDCEMFLKQFKILFKYFWE